MSEHPGPTNAAPVPELLPPAFSAAPRQRPALPQLTVPQLGWLIVAAAVTNLALRTGLATIAGTLSVLVVTNVVLDVMGRPRRCTVGLLVAAIVFAALLPLRASSWLTGLNTAAALFCLLAAAITARPVPMRLATSTIASLATRMWLARWFTAILIDAVQPLRNARTSRLMPVARGVAIAFIPVAVLTTLLASADAVFAQSITTDLRPSGLFSHLAVSGAAAAAIAALVAATGKPNVGPFEERRPLGATEAMILLSSIGALYAAFTLVQVYSGFGRADAILQDQGMTYAEYARSGFFQLLWVAALTLVLLGIVRLLVVDGKLGQPQRSKADSPRTAGLYGDRRAGKLGQPQRSKADSPGALDTAVRLTGSAVALLTTLIVAVAIHRLGLYTDAFGQTTLRWYCTAFAWLLGATFIAVAVGHWQRAERLLPGALLTLVAITMLAVNILNAEARVAEHNLSRPDALESLDALYLSGLSADAWPVLLDYEQLISAHLPAGVVLADQCAQADETRGYGPLGFNVAGYRLRCP